MAISKDLPGVEVTVEVDGVALKEYQDSDEADSAQTITRYIEAASGKEFAVNVVLSDGSKARVKYDALSVHVFADGHRAARKFFKKEKVVTGDNIKVQGFHHQDHITSFRFDDLDIVADGKQMSQEASKLRDVGTVSVKFFHAQVLAPTTGGSQPLPSKIGTVSEKALKGQAISHSVGSGAVLPKKDRRTFSTRLVEDAATFVFRYRSTEALKSLLIIPRSPTLQPLEERDTDTMSLEELREFHRRARETNGQRETKPKIKRERADENPRPRKVSRPNAGDAQLELDDEGNFRESSTAGSRRKELEVIELD